MFGNSYSFNSNDDSNICGFVDYTHTTVVQRKRQPQQQPQQQYQREHQSRQRQRDIQPEGQEIQHFGSRIPPHVRRFYSLDPGFPNDYPPGYKQAYTRLLSLVTPCLHPISAALGLKSTIIITGGSTSSSMGSGIGKSTLVKGVGEHLGVLVYEVNCYELLGSQGGHTEVAMKAAFNRAQQLAPCIFLLKHVNALTLTGTVQHHDQPPIAALLNSLIQNMEFVPPVIIIGTTNEPLSNLPTGIQLCFRDEIKLELPNLEQRKEIIDYLIDAKFSVNRDISRRKLAVNTASFSPRSLILLFDFVIKNAVTHAFKKYQLDPSQISDIVSAGIKISSRDIDASLEIMQKQSATNLGAPKIPNVKWEDIGGLVKVKQDILDTIQLPLEHPHLFGSGLKQRSGVLLYGPPGTGKTLLAKAVATECSLNFISVKGPELINMYIGESEKNIRDVFQKAREAKPCVIFFDELDSLAPNRGRSGDSGGVMDRVVSQLLAELSAVNSSGTSSDSNSNGTSGGAGNSIFVIGATNRPDLIDPALLVPGRFDKLLYLGVAEDKESQEKILEALTRKFTLHKDTKISNIATMCPNNLTGADFYALAADAYSIAMSRLIQQIEQKTTEQKEKRATKITTTTSSNNKQQQEQENEEEEETELELYRKGVKKAVVEVSEIDFKEALQKLTPSVSQQELQRYKQLQSKFAK